MKKHAFRRITAMVLVFVMCVFLMPTNSLGVKAVTADDVLVEESRVSSEIGAENPASEVEVIASEEADLPAEELALDEDVEEVSEETEEVEPLDALSENGTILLADEATEEWTLSYDDTTETFASFAEVSARIDALNNAEGVYTITCTNTSNTNLSLNSFPTVAKEVILKSSEKIGTVYPYTLNDFQTDIKITVEGAHLVFSKECTIKELYVDNGYILNNAAVDVQSVLQIEELTMVNNARMTATKPVKIEMCNMNGICTLDIGANGEWLGPITVEGKYEITTLNMLDGRFAFLTTDHYSDGYVALTTSSVITDANISQDTSKSLQGKVVNNNDGTYSIVLEAQKEYPYLLSYGNVEEEYKTYDEVVARIEERNSASTEYIIEMTDTNRTFGSVYSLPTKAKKVTFKSSGNNNSYIVFSTITSTVPIEFDGVRSVSFTACNLEQVTYPDAYTNLCFYGECSVNKLTIGNATWTYFYGNASIGTLTYKYISEYAIASLNFSKGTQYIEGEAFYSYGTAKINTISVAKEIKSIDVSVNYSEMLETPILEYVNYSATIWKMFNVSANNVPAGSAVNKCVTETGSRTLVIGEDTITNIELKYGDTTENFNLLQDAMSRIDAINNADNEYEITIIDFNDSITNPSVYDFPSAAKSLVVVNKAEIDNTLIMNDADGSIDYPVTFVDFHISIFGEDLSTKDFTIQSKTQDCALFANSNLNCDGTLYLDGVDCPRIGASITADTLKWKPYSAKSAETNLFMLTSEGTGGKIIADHLELAEGYRLKLNYERFDEDLDYMVINNYSEDCDRVDVKDFNYTDDAGNVYEAVMKVNDSNVCTYSRQVQQPYFYVTDSNGNTLINSRSWIDVQRAFDLSGDKIKTYIIQVANGKEIGTLPTNAGTIILAGDGGATQSLIKVSKSTLETKVNFEIHNAKLGYGADNAPVSIKLANKSLFLLLDNVTNVGTISGNNGFMDAYGTVDVAKIDKLMELYVSDDANLTVSGDVSNITALSLHSDMYAWGNISLTDLRTGGDGRLHYDLSKKLTVKGTVSFFEEMDPEYRYIELCPYQGGVTVTEFVADTVIIDECKLADSSDFRVNGLTDTQVLYRSGSAVKIGTPVITVFENYTSDWKTADVSEGKQFATINDAIVHVNEEIEGNFIIRLEQDITTTETLKTIQGTADKYVAILNAKEQMATLTFKGTFIVDGVGMQIINVDLRNSAKANASVTLKNGATLHMVGVAVNALTAPVGTGIYIGDLEGADVDVVINGTAKCAGEVIMADNAVLWCKGALTAGNFTLDGEYAEVRILTGKAFTINGNVNIGEDSLVCINRVDKNGNLATIKAGTAMVTADKAVAGQFYTQNIMTGTEDVYWLLTKSGKVIKTAGLAAYVCDMSEGEQEGEFASFNEAKEYIMAQEDGNDYVIELLCDTSGADLTDIPENLIAILKSESVTAETVKLTTSLDVTLSGNLDLYGVNLVASKKTINANGYDLYVDNSGGITAARVKELNAINVYSGTVTFTAKDSTINYVQMGPDGTFKCPQFTGFAQG